MQQPTSSTATNQSRRDFLKSSTAAVVGGAVAANLSLRQSAYAGGDDVLRVGLIGCGGRGGGAAQDALSADPNTKLVALGDAFEDCARAKLADLKNSAVADRVAVDDDHLFVGFDNYKHVIANCDVVLLATPPHFRPQHLRAVVEAGKHCFVEKPVAVDAPGIRSVLESCELAKKKGLSIVSGLCWRYHPTIVETFKRIHGGSIGDITAMQCSYNSVGVWDPNDPKSYHKPREQCRSDMEYQMRNWYYYNWLSGDFNVEQHVHSLDKMQWAMHDEPPVSASGTGGRQVRTGPEYGNIYDHFSVVYEYANGVKAFARCRHWRGCDNDVTDHLFGTKGTCHISGDRSRIEGTEEYRPRRIPNRMYQLEHVAFFASIRSGEPINNGQYMSRSSMLAIMGRMSAYTGKTVTWEQAMSSTERLGPSEYTWGPLEVAPVATPGLTHLA